MARCYMQVYYDFIHSLEPLSDGETGRLFIAMLQYAQQGTLPDFRGNERFIWPTIKAQIDRDNARYDEISQSRSEAGRLGGRPKANALAGKQEEQPRSVKSKNNHNDDKDNKKNEKDNDQEEDNEANINAENSNGGSLKCSTSEEKTMKRIVAWNAVFDLAQQIGIPDTIADRIKCDSLIAEYSDDWMIEAVKRAGNAPASARSWRYIEGILRKWRVIGRIDEGKPSEKKSGKIVIEQQYNQRDYSNMAYGSLSPEEIEEAMQYEV